jgi:hypothetical protein
MKESGVFISRFLLDGYGEACIAPAAFIYLDNNMMIL